MVENAYKVTFREMPFTPVKGQVIYYDPNNNKRINSFIVHNYEWLKNTFLQSGLDFCYLPLLGDELISYHAPYINKDQRHELILKTPSIASYIKSVDCELQVPSLLYAVDDLTPVIGDEIEMRLIAIDPRWFDRLKKVFSKLAGDIKKDLASHYSSKQSDTPVVNEPDIRFSLREIIDEEADADLSSNENRPTVRRSRIEFSIGLRRKEADEVFDEQAKVLVKEIKERINALRDFGVNTMFLHNIIDEGEHISSLYITKDYRIILPDYDNMEIIIPDLPKAVFLLFLKHPEGIRFKELPEYYEELLQIYLNLNPMGSRQRQENSIKSVTDPLGNSINEKCARVREAFISKFDDRLAKNYYITGERGEPKRITLDKKLIVWEQ